MYDTAPDSPAMGFVVLILLFLLACPICSAVVAASKGRATGSWFVMGLVFGPFGLLAIVGMPTLEGRAVQRAQLGKESSMKICPYCIEPVREEASVCSHCTHVIVEQPDAGV